MSEYKNCFNINSEDFYDEPTSRTFLREDRITMILKVLSLKIKQKFKIFTSWKKVTMLLRRRHNFGKSHQSSSVRFFFYQGNIYLRSFSTIPRTKTFYVQPQATNICSKSYQRSHIKYLTIFVFRNIFRYSLCVY